MAWIREGRKVPAFYRLLRIMVLGSGSQSTRLVTESVLESFSFCRLMTVYRAFQRQVRRS